MNEADGAAGSDPRAAASRLTRRRATALIADQDSGAAGGTPPAEAAPGPPPGTGSGRPDVPANPLGAPAREGVGGPSAGPVAGRGATGTAGDAPGASAGLPGAAGSAGRPGFVPPEGDTLRDKAGHLAGQALDEGARQGAASAGVPPPVYDAAKRLLDTKAGRALLDRSPGGRLLPKSVKDGFFKSGGGKGGPGGSADDETGDSSAASGSGRYAMALAVTLPVLLPLLCVLLIATLVLGTQASFDATPSQPPAKSDEAVAEYFPPGWQQMLKHAAERAEAGAPVHAAAPWTILAGLAAAQTTFARYSPYDAIDRDPGRSVQEIPTGGGTEGRPAPESTAPPAPTPTPTSTSTSTPTSTSTSTSTSTPTSPAIAPTTATVALTGRRTAPTGSPSGTPSRADAGGCVVDVPSPPIGGKGTQGSGPYLLGPAAAAEMRRAGLDPQNPCDASGYVGRKLSATARKMGDDPSNPYEMPAGSEGRQERAREYWAKVIAASGLFTALGTAPETAPEEECSVPRPDDPDKPWSISFKVIFIWSCAGARSAEPHLVTGSRYADGSVEFEVEPDRSAAIKVLVDEALAVSYAAGGWETRRCDDGADGRQGVFPMTRQEAAAARVTDRCDVDANIAGAARLVLGDEAVQPRSRAAGLGPFQPMAGGWQRLSVAMGDDLGLFSKVGPSRNYTGTEACTTVMTAYLRAIAPHAAEFAALREVPTASELRRAWDPKLTALRGAHGVTAPESDPACAVGSWARGFNAALAEHATELAGADPAGGPNLIGLGNYYQGKEDAIRPIEPVPGKDTLVIPRLAVRPLEDVGAPIAPDATEAWSRAGTGEGVSLPVAQRAVDFAWFFGGVIEPFDSAGERIGSLLNDDPEGSGPNDDPEGSGPNDDPEGSGPNDDPEGSGPKDDPEGSGKPAPKQTEVGPDGCPTKAPPNTLRQGAAKIGIAKLCADAVAKARTPEAAKAIKWALSQGLGLKYSMPRRNEPGFADCSSFVSRAYRDAIPGLYTGNAPTTHTLRGLSWTRKIPLGRAKPGDLVEPHPGHVAMQLAGGYKVHTNRTGDVAHVTRGYSSATWVGWVDPAKV